MTPASLVLLAGGLLASSDAPSSATKMELENLQGTWNAVRVEADGKALPEDVIHGWTLTVDGAKYSLHEKDRTLEGVLKIDPLTTPRAINAVQTAGTDKGKTLWGIYRLEGDRLQMCFVNPDRHVRPKEFTTGGTDGGQSLYVFKRAAKK